MAADHVLENYKSFEWVRNTLEKSKYPVLNIFSSDLAMSNNMPKLNTIEKLKSMNHFNLKSKNNKYKRNFYCRPHDIDGYYENISIIDIKRSNNKYNVIKNVHHFIMMN
ncbi:hypothetical protein PIROE2DRAFT_8857 [Piromyces sp. E2]|nr:hypothetical protein PIROE2DRAFT_8857 [Piromyces sp. E2]|eukprot:OUM64384.1 hypothetical protein PIROE2DRAFT_8857 [Piromyces sp. E2]